MTKAQLQTKLTEQTQAHTQTINIFKQGHAKRDHTIKEQQILLNKRAIELTNLAEALASALIERDEARDTVIEMSEKLSDKDKEQFQDAVNTFKTAGAFAIGGATVSSIIGGAGVAIAGTAIGIGIGGFIATGALIGTTGYAGYKAYQTIKGV